MKKVFLVYFALFCTIFAFSCKEIMESQPWRVYNCKKSNEGIFPKKSIREPILHMGFDGKIGEAIFIDTTYNFESCIYYTVWACRYPNKDYREFNEALARKGDTLIRNAGSDTITIRHKGMDYCMVCYFKEEDE